MIGFETMRGLAVTFLLVSLASCKGQTKLEGHWKGTHADGVLPEQQLSANQFATSMEIDVRGSQIAVKTAKDVQMGTFRVEKEEKGLIVITTDRDPDPQTFHFAGANVMKWEALPGKTIVFARK